MQPSHDVTIEYHGSAAFGFLDFAELSDFGALLFDRILFSTILYVLGCQSSLSTVHHARNDNCERDMNVKLRTPLRLIRELLHEHLAVYPSVHHSYSHSAEAII